MENNHVLVPGDYDLEWHRAELYAANDWQPPEGWEDPPDLATALDMSRRYGRAAAPQVQPLLVRSPWTS